MELRGGETIIFNLGDIKAKWQLSKIDGKLVKIFDENGTYKQMPYDNFMELLEKGFAEIYKDTEIEDMG
ncbi:hypothetical protein SDC9_158691 [bioreactor metagenome]|uniref:Uncharacterized protein n=1 Tax=bioreactor metagenome TaxID=1076179 RepID=A0A645FBU5_9ZZZZ|nr:hypothetical protein [Lutispora sp.]MEA4962555.1 hypothetical protein [Lutispora sp.]